MTETPNHTFPPTSLKRILLCSFGAPLPDEPHAFVWNLKQAQALTDLGVETQIFRPVPYCPRWLGLVSQRARRALKIPERYVFEGITIHAPRVFFAYPPFIRSHLIKRFPQLIVSAMKLIVGPALRRHIAAFSPDCLLVDWTIPWGYMAAAAAAHHGIKLALIEHSGDFLARIRRHSPIGRVFTNAATHAQAVFVVGEPMRQHLISELQLPNVVRINNGIMPPAEQLFAVPPPPETEGRTILLSVAQYYRLKGFEELIEAFARLAGRYPLADLYIVSDLPPELRQRIAQLALDSRIKILGRLPFQQVQQWMVWADLFVQPSWTEAFGLVYGEAMAAATPVIMTDSCGFSHIIQPWGKTTQIPHGWVVKPRDVDSLTQAIDQALSDPNLLRTMGDAGRQFVLRELTWRNNAKSVLAALAD